MTDGNTTGDDSERIEFAENGIEVSIEARFGDTIDGWAESREDLGLNKHGDPVAGVELIEEVPHYYEEDDEYPRGHGPVTLRFPDADALDEAREHLRKQATQRFEWGADGEAVQDFIRHLPTKYEVNQLRDSADQDTDTDSND